VSSRNFVCPHDPALLGRFRGRTVAVRVDDPGQVCTAVTDVAKSGNKLLCVILSPRLPLDTVKLFDEWKDIPVVLMCPGLGRFRKLAGRLNLCRKLNLRVFLPCSRANLVGLRILASLGIPCGVTFGVKEPDWEALTDLMTYAILGAAPHAAIEPFTFIAHRYKPAEHTKWGCVYFDDPEEFLHLDSSGHVAFSQRELLGGRFISREIDRLETLDEVPGIADDPDRGKGIFLENNPCSVCGGWRLCRGAFARKGRHPDGCSEFFAELMEVVERFQGLSAGGHKQQKW